jgi:hypothetical protein
MGSVLVFRTTFNVSATLELHATFASCVLKNCTVADLQPAAELGTQYCRNSVPEIYAIDSSRRWDRRFFVFCRLVNDSLFYFLDDHIKHCYIPNFSDHQFTNVRLHRQPNRQHLCNSSGHGGRLSAGALGDIIGGIMGGFFIVAIGALGFGLGRQHGQKVSQERHVEHGSDKENNGDNEFKIDRVPNDPEEKIVGAAYGIRETGMRFAFHWIKVD